MLTDIRVLADLFLIALPNINNVPRYYHGPASQGISMSTEA